MQNYTPTPDFYNEYIAHFGITGMKWGKRNGPPYPLGRDKSTGRRLKNTGSVKKKKKTALPPGVKTVNQGPKLPTPSGRSAPNPELENYRKEKIQEFKKLSTDKNIPAEYRQQFKNQIKYYENLDDEKLIKYMNYEKGGYKESNSQDSYDKVIRDLNKKYKVKPNSEYYVRDRKSTWSNYKEMAKDFGISESKAKNMWDYSEEVDKQRKKYGIE